MIKFMQATRSSDGTMKCYMFQGVGFIIVACTKWEAQTRKNILSRIDTHFCSQQKLSSMREFWSGHIPHNPSTSEVAWIYGKITLFASDILDVSSD